VSASGAPRLSVVVPTHGRPDAAARAVRAWLAQEAAPEMEVVLVDDGSGPEAVRRLTAALPDDPRLRFVPRAHAGPAATRNTGLDLARGAALLFADDDVAPVDGGTLARWWARLEPDRPAWVPRMSTPDALVRTPLQAAWRDRLEGGGRRRDGARLGPGGFWFAALLVDRAALHGQRFDEAFAGYGWEDMEFGLRLHRAGTAVRLATDVRVWHEDAVRLPVLLAKHEAMGRAAWTFRRLHPGARAAWWTGTTATVRAWRRWVALERRGAAAAARLATWVDAAAPDRVPSAWPRDLRLALEGAYARGVRLGRPMRRGGGT
jgi:GT2 family glycosyltransferase